MIVLIKNTFMFRGFMKALFFRLRLDRFIPIRLFLFFAHIAEVSKWIAKNKKTCQFNDATTFNIDYSNRLSLYKHIISTENLDSSGIDYLEFGVASGVSFKWWINNIHNKEARFYGFDTFTGLPEPWGPFRIGDFNDGNKQPEIDDDRHSFYQGLFQQTLLPFLNNYKPNKRKVIHLDADLYSATLYVLTLITPYLNKGDIILFDEFNVPMHEYKAFKEWKNSFYIKTKVLGGVNNFFQTAFIIE